MRALRAGSTVGELFFALFLIGREVVDRLEYAPELVDLLVLHLERIVGRAGSAVVIARKEGDLEVWQQQRWSPGV